MSVISALIPPLGMALLLVVLTLSAGKQPVALVMESSGPAARTMAQIIQSDTEAYALRITDAVTAERMLADQEVAGVVVIPPGFDRGVLSHDATLDLTLNNVDIDFADDIRRAVARSVAQFDAPQLGLQGEIGGPSAGILLPNPYRIAIDEQDLRRTNVDFLHFQVVPALILLVLNVGLMGTALLCAQDLDRGMARHLLLAPVPSFSLIVGRLLGGLLASMAVLFPALAICWATGIISPPTGHWPAVLTLFLATSLSASGLGALLGTVIRGSRAVAMAASVVATYLFFLGGGFTTIAFLPAPLRALSAAIPMRYAIDGLRQCLFYPNLDGVARDLLVLGATALAASAIGATAMRTSWGG